MIQTTKTVEWIGSTGKNVELEISYTAKIVDQKVWADGNDITLKNQTIDETFALRLSVGGEILDESKNFNGKLYLVHEYDPNNAGQTHVYGRLFVRPEVGGQIQTALDEIATEVKEIAEIAEIMDKEETAKTADENAQERLDAQEERVDGMMTLNGASY